MQIILLLYKFGQRTDPVTSYALIHAVLTVSIFKEVIQDISSVARYRSTAITYQTYSPGCLVRYHPLTGLSRFKVSETNYE